MCFSDLCWNWKEQHFSWLNFNFSFLSAEQLKTTFFHRSCFIRKINKLRVQLQNSEKLQIIRGLSKNADQKNKLKIQMTHSFMFKGKKIPLVNKKVGKWRATIIFLSFFYNNILKNKHMNELIRQYFCTFALKGTN
jgi:hypothetical protein